MATIYYSMAGEGRGHATRVKAIVDDLMQRHRVVLYAPGEAWDLLHPTYRGSPVEVRHLEGLSFHYDSLGKLNYYRTLLEGVRHYFGFPSHLDQIRKDMEWERPQLVITDFDPLLPRVAEQLGIPYLSINHQHFLRTYDLSSLPLRLRGYAAILGWGVRCFYGSQKATIVSSFFSPPLKSSAPNTYQTGVLLRPEVYHVASLTPAEPPFITAYLRRNVPRRLIRALRDCGLPVHIYGLGKLPAEDLLQFHEVHPQHFLHHLATGKALICTAGNQLIGESIHLKRPVLALPETGNHEQEINGHFVEQMGIGECHSINRLRSNHIRTFLNRLELYQNNMHQYPQSGNQTVKEIIEKYIKDCHV